MGFKEALGKLLSKRKESNAYVEELDKQDRAIRKLTQRKKSSDERELERFLQEEREANIKEELNLHRQIRASEGKMKSPTIVPNVFEEGKSIRVGNIFSHESSIMRRNIFT